MALTLYDLRGNGEHRFSPYCWRIRMALAHKGLKAAIVPIGFTEKDRIAFSGQSLVPILVDGETIVFDSWRIATYLEDTYPDRPSLFDGESARALSRFLNEWTPRALHRTLVPLIIRDVLDHVAPEDRTYFRETREVKLGTTLEALQKNREQAVSAFRDALAPVRETLKHLPYLGGETAKYADFIVFGVFQWARCVSEFQLLEPDDPVYAWRARMLELYDGLAAKAPGYPC